MSFRPSKAPGSKPLFSRGFPPISRREAPSALEPELSCCPYTLGPAGFLSWAGLMDPINCSLPYLPLKAATNLWGKLQTPSCSRTLAPKGTSPGIGFRGQREQEESESLWQAPAGCLVALALSLSSLCSPLVSLHLVLATLGYALRQGSGTFCETHSGWKRSLSLTLPISHLGEDCPRPGSHLPMQFMLRSPLNTPLGTLRMRLS